ncbi:MAG: hypothetical protein JSS20_22370, partial [Proteobacteria bacterium]|nr:hypothetical protein [Pseudomonadota bacterium]
QADAKQGPFAKTLLVARVIAIVAAVGGAVPTAMNLYHSWANGIPYTEVSHRLDQAAVWERNFECKIEYRALTTAQGTRVDAGACGKTGDVSIKVTTPTGKAAYEWIAFDKLQKASKTALIEALIGPAEAGELPVQLVQAAPAAPAAPSSGGMKVMCEAMPAKGTIVRVLQDGAKCYRERVSLFRGAVEKRDEVACSTPCK